MPNGEHELTFSLRYGFNDPRGERWRIIRLSVGQDMTWDMLPNPTVPRSTISRHAFADLALREQAIAGNARRAVLRDLLIAGQPVPDLEVRISQVVARLGVDGILGLDFFEQFASVLWLPRTGQMTLRLP